VTATQPLARVWLPSDGTALGVDWSGSEKAFKKIWCSKIEFGSGGACLREVQKPFSSQGPASISSHFAQWLEAQEFDVAGLDFCFGLNAQHLQSLALPNLGPVTLGARIVERWSTPEAFRAAVGAERKRETDRLQAAPFAPTNLRMFRQTYWGLVALARHREVPPPWKYGVRRNVVEVLPAQVARMIAPGRSYKERTGQAARRALVSEVERACRLSIADELRSVLIGDPDGDAIDAVLAAIAAGSARAYAFIGAPDSAVGTGEGWIFPCRAVPDRRAYLSGAVGPEAWPRDVIAAHEAGHAMTYLACGIGVASVEAIVRRVPTPTGTATRFGWTESLEEQWTTSLGLKDGDARLARRLLGKAGGLAGEMVAGLFDYDESAPSARDDVAQIGAALVRLGILSPGAKETPEPCVFAAVERACGLLQSHRHDFDELRRRLMVEDTVVPAPVRVTWDDDDREFVEELAAKTSGR